MRFREFMLEAEPARKIPFQIFDVETKSFKPVPGVTIKAGTQDARIMNFIQNNPNLSPQARNLAYNRMNPANVNIPEPKGWAAKFGKWFQKNIGKIGSKVNPLTRIPGLNFVTTSTALNTDNDAYIEMMNALEKSDPGLLQKLEPGLRPASKPAPIGDPYDEPAPLEVPKPGPQGDPYDEPAPLEVPQPQKKPQGDPRYRPGTVPKTEPKPKPAPQGDPRYRPGTVPKQRPQEKPKQQPRPQDKPKQQPRPQTQRVPKAPPPRPQRPARPLRPVPAMPPKPIKPMQRGTSGDDYIYTRGSQRPATSVKRLK